jgi:hypothetical protein
MFDIPIIKQAFVRLQQRKQPYSVKKTPSRLRSIKDKHTGERKLIERVKRVKQWWFVADNGRVCLQVRYGTKVLELAKGKNSIDVGAVADLLPVLETVKKCVEAGELDVQIDAASAAVRERFEK